MAQDDQLWASTQRELQEMHDRLEELRDWSEDEMDARAFIHTCDDAIAKVRNLAIVAAQFRVGVLPQKPPIHAREVECPRCFILPGAPCDFEAKPRYHADTRDYHRERLDVARTVTTTRDQEHMDAAEKALADR